MCLLSRSYCLVPWVNKQFATFLRPVVRVRSHLRMSIPRATGPADFNIDDLFLVKPGVDSEIVARKIAVARPHLKYLLGFSRIHQNASSKSGAIALHSFGPQCNPILP